MANISNYLSNKLLDHIWTKAAYPMPTTYLGLYSTVPTMPQGSLGVELAGSNYARVPLAGQMGAAAAGSNANAATLMFNAASNVWGTANGVGVFDGTGAAANLLEAGPLADPKPIGAGDTFVINVGQLVDSFT